MLSEKEIQFIERLRTSVPLLSAERLEGASSALFLIDGKTDYDEDIMKESLRAWKPDFTNEQIVLSIDDAKKVLYKEENVTPELKAEFLAWQMLGRKSITNSSPTS